MVDVNGTVSSYISNSTIRYAGLPPVVNATLPTVLIPVPVGKARRPDPRFITISRNNVVCCTLVEQVSTGYRKWVLDRDADKKGMAEAFYDSSDKWTPE
jgi:hypothetical protein